MRQIWRRVANYGVFYSVWIAMIFGETYLWAIAGYLLGFVTFVVGGVMLARYHNGKTLPGEQPIGWPLRLAKWTTFRYPKFGLAVNAFLNGAPGVGIVETALGHPWPKVRTRAIIAAVGYATLWGIIHYLRPHNVAPIYWHPSLVALLQLWHVVWLGLTQV